MASPLSTIASPNYSIQIGDAAPDQLNSFLKKNKFSKIFILVDENSLQHCLPQLVSRVKKLAEAEIIELESGEKNKTIEVCLNVWRVLGELGADRQSLLINLGGGVITDMGGFIAATFKRGIAFVNVPTTLLAQIDASVGGKTGVDLDGLKNEVGAFADPKELFVFPGFLRSLPRRQMLSGFAEALKHGLVAEKEYWDKLITVNVADDVSWDEIILRSIRIKSEIVDKDPFETGRRKVLNFGHTIGHALESFFLEGGEASLLHGEAVVVGMICESWMSNQLAGLKENELEEITQSLLQLYGTVEIDPMTDHRLIELMRHDKKNENGIIYFTLLDAIGKPVINKKAAATDIIDAINYYRTVSKLAIKS
ncbi:MAG: 3-dehydroquinate synthase [Bacteroidota bacterium]|nr:3-dehydroquinate synthase [Bacteroidota bacterium]